MKLLVLDTAMAACSAAVYDSEQASAIASAFAAMERGHAEAIAPMVRAVMAKAGLEFRALDRIAVTKGPGTFTGVRIGLAMARGLGLALDRPVIGIDTLSAIAANETSSGIPLLVAADARRNEVYAALFDAKRNLLIVPTVIAIEDCLRRLPDDPIVVIGSAADAIIAAAGRNDLKRSRAGDLPAAANFSSLFRHPGEGRGPDTDGVPAFAGMTDSLAPEPLYLRPPDAKPQALVQRQPISVTIRDAGAENANILAVIHGECFDTPWPPADFAKLMAMPGSSAAIAMEFEEPVGFVLLRRAADEAEIISIATRPFAQRRGVAKALVDHQCKRLGAQGVKALFIEVAASNAGARALYDSTGFIAAGTRKGYYQRAGGRREDAIIMRRELAR